MTTELSTKPRAATFAERCVWGVCPVCGAAHGAPSVLIAYGDSDSDKLRASGIAGKFIDLRVTA